MYDIHNHAILSLLHDRTGWWTFFCMFWSLSATVRVWNNSSDIFFWGYINVGLSNHRQNLATSGRTARGTQGREERNEGIWNSTETILLVGVDDEWLLTAVMGFLALYIFIWASSHSQQMAGQSNVKLLCGSFRYEASKMPEIFSQPMFCDRQQHLEKAMSKCERE